MKILRLVFWSFLFSILALFLSDQILYRLWLLPQLTAPQYIPAYKYLLVFLPILFVIISFGLMLSSWKQVWLIAFIAAVSYQMHNYLSLIFRFPGYLINNASENPYGWLLRASLMFCIYMVVFSIVWYSKVVLQKTFARLPSRPFLQDNDGKGAKDINDNKNEGRMPARITYHVVPDPSGWLVKKGKAKKASSAHSTKEEALHAASDVAKSHPLSQVVVHNASGVIESDRTYEYRHYKKKKKKKEISRRIRKGLKRNKRKESEQRLRRRKAAQLGIARLKRKKYLRRQIARRAALKRNKKKK